MSGRRRKIRVTVRFHGRDGRDPKGIFDAIEQTLRPSELEVDVLAGTESDADPRHIPDEQLETEVRKTASRRLEEKNKAIQEGEKTIASSPTEQEKFRTSVLSKLSKLAGSAWRIAIQTVLDWAATIFK